MSGGTGPEMKYGNRFPDLVLEKGNKRISIQIGHATEVSRLPVARERRAIADLRALGDFDHVFFLKY